MIISRVSTHVQTCIVFIKNAVETLKHIVAKQLVMPMFIQRGDSSTKSAKHKLTSQLKLYAIYY